jgi:hypothetical protein
MTDPGQIGEPPHAHHMRPIFNRSGAEAFGDGDAE